MFSNLEHSFKDYERKTELKAMSKECPPFPESELTEEKRKERLRKAQADFWFFDATYFPQEMYSDGYSEPDEFHKRLIAHATEPGVQIVLAARSHAKTANMKKYITWELLTGRLKFGGSLSSTLPISRNIAADIADLIDSDRIAFDFKPVFEERNAEQFTLRIPNVRGAARFMVYSEGRSMRGSTKLFDRPQKILCDDLETRESALTSAAVEERIRFLSESYKSMSAGATLIALGNNFDEKCAYNRLKQEQEAGLLPKDWQVHTYPAWNGAPLWKKRYPATSELELRAMLKPLDEAEWQSDFQQCPTPPDGFIFKRIIPLPKWSEIPTDARGVVYCDPNLAKKGKGDTTAIVPLLYSPSSNIFYVPDVVCRSFSDPNKLLDAYFSFEGVKIIANGFDGHVSQESTWSAFVKNYSQIKKIPVRRIEYRRYKPDELAKNVSGVWNECRILLPPNIEQTSDGKEFLTQLFAFCGKKANLKDDAPDALICAYELLCERGIYRPQGKARKPTSITDYYNF